MSTTDAPPVLSTEQALARLNPTLRAKLLKALRRAGRDREAGRFTRAIEGYREVLRFLPGNPEAMYLMATTAIAAREMETAADVLDELLLQQPDDAGVLTLKASVLLQLDRPDEAIGTARRAILKDAELGFAWNVLGLGLSKQDRLVEAARAFEKAARYEPDSAEPHFNLGCVLANLGLVGDATEAYRAAVDREPTNGAYVGGLATALARMSRPLEALQVYEEALALSPDDDRLVYNRSFVLLSLGRLDPGWVDNDRGLGLGVRLPSFDFPGVPVWDGSSLEGKRLLVTREQGIGDELLFAQLYPELIERCEHLLIGCEPRLVPAYTRSFPEATVRALLSRDGGFSPAEPPMEFDVHIPCASLPRYLRPTLDDFPPTIPHLVPDAVKRVQWQERLAALGPGPKVGVAWRSMVLSTDRLTAYATLQELAPVLRLPGVTFLSVQHGDLAFTRSEVEAAEAELGVRIHFWPDVDPVGDIDGALTLFSCLDAVISVSSTPSPMAGSMGVPCAELGLEYNWLLLGQEQTPWYPTQRNFHRRWDESWERPVEGVRDWLVDLLDLPA